MAKNIGTDNDPSLSVSIFWPKILPMLKIETFFKNIKPFSGIHTLYNTPRSKKRNDKTTKRGYGVEFTGNERD
ncbi:hypothetical protein LQZ18_17605 [Lachnospiraceae bacterium ZAX-1]